MLLHYTPSRSAVLFSKCSVLCLDHGFFVVFMSQHRLTGWIVDSAVLQEAKLARDAESIANKKRKAEMSGLIWPSPDRTVGRPSREKQYVENCINTCNKALCLRRCDLLAHPSGGILVCPPLRIGLHHCRGGASNANGCAVPTPGIDLEAVTAPVLGVDPEAETAPAQGNVRQRRLWLQASILTETRSPGKIVDLEEETAPVITDDAADRESGLACSSGKGGAWCKLSWPELRQQQRK